MIPFNDFNATLDEYKLWEEKENSTLVRFHPAKDKKSDAAIVIFPGGGYIRKAEHEGRDYGVFFAENGINAFVVDYHVAPDYFPLPLADARRSVRFVRYYAEKFGIDPNKISVMGSSAGGHLAALVSTYRDAIEGENTDAIDKEDYLPNAQILCYPVISTVDDSIRHVGSGLNLLGEDNLDFAPKVSPDLIADEKTPQAFIWHTAADNGVNVINSYEYASALRRKNVPVEMHIFPEGGHGLGLCVMHKSLDEDNKKMRRRTGLWKELLLTWLSYIGYLN